MVAGDHVIKLRWTHAEALGAARRLLADGCSLGTRWQGASVTIEFTIAVLYYCHYLTMRGSWLMGVEWEDDEEQGVCMTPSTLNYPPSHPPLVHPGEGKSETQDTRHGRQRG